MIYIAQKSCVFSRRIKLPATQENTANPGEFPANSRLIPANPGELNSLLHTQSPPSRTQEREKLSQHWYDFSPCFSIVSPSQVCLLERCLLTRFLTNFWQIKV